MPTIYYYFSAPFIPAEVVELPLVRRVGPQFVNLGGGAGTKAQGRRERREQGEQGEAMHGFSRG